MYGTSVSRSQASKHFSCRSPGGSSIDYHRRARIVAAEKIVAAVIQALIAGLVVLPIARLIMGPIPGLSLAHGGEIVFIALLGATAFSSLGMWLGTAISPQQIGLMFSVIVAPMIFFGCAYYTWRGLDAVHVVKYLVILHSHVYVAE